MQMAKKDRGRILWGCELPFSDDPVEIEAAVMFTDIVGFTRWSEVQPPQTVFMRLQRVFSRIEEIVLANGGTLCAFLGDGSMAAFDPKNSSGSGAVSALAAAVGIADEFARWNRRRAERGGGPVIISIGLHSGPVVIGKFGRHRSTEPTVVGDTVNVARRLEGLTREASCQVAVSAEVVRRSQDCESARPDLCEQLNPIGRCHLPGRRAPIEVWTYSSRGTTDLPIGRAAG